MLYLKIERVKVCLTVAMETLRGDLKKISRGSAELVSRASLLQAPSWKFPEKLAVTLDVDEALKDGLKQETNAHNFLLELVVDRYADMP